MKFVAEENGRNLEGKNLSTTRIPHSVSEKRTRDPSGGKLLNINMTFNII